MSLSGQMFYHDSCADCYGAAAVRVRDNITIADGKKRYGYQPHGVQEVSVLLGMIAEK